MVGEKEDMTARSGCYMAVQNEHCPCTSAVVPFVSTSFNCLLILNLRWIILFARAQDAARPWKENGKQTQPFFQTWMMGNNLNFKKKEWVINSVVKGLPKSFFKNATYPPKKSNLPSCVETTWQGNQYLQLTQKSCWLLGNVDSDVFDG